MTSMVERMARAIFDAAHEHEAPSPSYDDAEKGLQRIFRATALAALRELREPTDGMVEAVLLHAQELAAREHTTELRPSESYAVTYVRKSFTAAIDAEIAAYEAGRADPLLRTP